MSFQMLDAWQESRNGPDSAANQQPGFDISAVSASDSAGHFFFNTHFRTLFSVKFLTGTKGFTKLLRGCSQQGSFTHQQTSQ